MSNAMKKLKLLHHLTAASSTSLPPPAAAQQAQQQQQQQQQTSQHQTTASSYFATAPTSPLSPRNFNPFTRPTFSPFTFNHNHNNHHHHHQTPAAPAPPCALPGGFMVLTPVTTTATDTTPGLAVPASPPAMAIASSQIPRASQHSNGIYSSRPPMHYSTASPASRAKPRPRLTRDAVAKIGKDSRLARWERVLGYVRDQRSNTPQPAAGSLYQSVTPIAGESESTPGWASYVSAGNDSPLSNTPPSRTQDRKRRASELAAIEAKTKLLDQVDLAEQDLRSLWSGGSGGTNGVDEFVWSEDDDDDILPMPQAPPPLKPVVVAPVAAPVAAEKAERAEREDMIFEMEDPVQQGMKSAGLRKPRTSWGFARPHAVEEMPMLCREAELEGGLGRLVGRRMSAAY